jgi:hypothetical protein
MRNGSFLTNVVLPVYHDTLIPKQHRPRHIGITNIACIHEKSTSVKAEANTVECSAVEIEFRTSSGKSWPHLWREVSGLTNFALAADECFEALKAMQKALKIQYLTGALIGEQVVYSRLDKISFPLLVEKQVFVLTVPLKTPKSHHD